MITIKILYILGYIILAQFFGYLQLHIDTLKRHKDGKGGIPYNQLFLKYWISVFGFPFLLIGIILTGIKNVFKRKNRN